MPNAMLAAETGSDFAPLLREVRALGLLKRRRRHYALTIAVDVALYAMIWATVVVCGDTWWQLALAAPAAVFTARLYYVGHDAGHSQIARTNRINKLLGTAVGGLLIGLSYSWWVDKHNRHHANPNQVGKDPDVAAGALVWTPEQAETRGGVNGWVARHQAGLFFPMLLLEGFNLKLASFRGRRGSVETTLLIVHLAAYVALVFVAMSPWQALAFLGLHQALLGVCLGCAFAPNHKGMAMPAPGERWDFLRKQVLTSRNVRGGRLVDWALGGLNYQVEHHLFPNMPRCHLRHAQPVVRRHCAKLGLPYTEAGAFRSYAQALRHLRSVGAHAS